MRMEAADQSMPVLPAAPAGAAGLGRGVAWTVLAAVLLGSLSLKLNHIGHDALHAMDESFHAVVARNLLDRPFTPLLYADPARPYDYRDWKANHVWLHKPILPLWQMGACMAAFGVEPWAMRLPSAVLATGVAWLVYLIGAAWFGRGVGLIAAGLAAVNPSIHTLVHGYIFSDHVDVALLFYVTLGAWLAVRAAQSGRAADAALAGVAQGAAFLSKTYPGLIVTVVVAAMWLIGRQARSTGRVGLTLRQVPWFAAAAAASAGPWLAACAIRFPREFWYEQGHALMHLTRDVEQFAGPWDRVVADYLLRLNHVFYPALLVSLVACAVAAWRGRDGRLWTLLAWWGVTVGVFVLATSKTPTSTAIALPAGWLLMAAAAGRAWAGDRFAAGALSATLILGAAWPGEFPRQGWGYAEGGRFAGVLRENLWPWAHAAAGLAVGGAAAGLAAGLRRPARRTVEVYVTAAAMALPAAWLGYRQGRTAWRITELNRVEPTFRDLGRLAAERLPEDAVLLVEESGKFQHVAAMFWTRRACYGTTAATLERDRAALAASGRPVYLVSLLERPLPAVGLADGRAVYAFPQD